MSDRDYHVEIRSRIEAEDPVNSRAQIPKLRFVSGLTGLFLQSLTLMVLCLSIPPDPAHGQTQPKIISGGPTCFDCTIERYLVATIHDSTYSEGALGDAVVPHVNSDGTFLVIGGPGLSFELYLAGRDGAIARRVGQAGEGPGEYRLPMYVAESDSLFLVLDPGLGRVTYLRIPSCELHDTAPIPAGLRAGPSVAFPDGSYVMWSPGYTRSTAGHGLHHVSTDGRILRSFGPPIGGDLPALALAGDSAVWIGFDDYRIEKWSIQGDRLAAFIRVADWVRPKDDETELGDRFTWLSGLREDEDGLIWVNTSVREKAAFGGDPDPATAESIIEVLNPSALTVVAQSRMPGRKEGVVPGFGFYLGELRTSPTGLTLKNVWRFRLLRPPFFPRSRRDHGSD